MARKKQGAEAVLDPVETSLNEMSTETVEATAPEAAEAAESKSTKVRVAGERMTGQALLDYAQANQGMTAEELAYGAGYYTKETDTETGETKTRLHQKEFFRSLTEASTGLTLPTAKRAYTGRRSRAPIITVGKTGNCVVGSRHSTVAGFAPESKVLVTAEEGRIILTPYEGEEEVAEQNSDDDLGL